MLLWNNCGCPKYTKSRWSQYTNSGYSETTNYGWSQPTNSGCYQPTNHGCSQSTISMATINYNINWSRNTIHTLLNRLIEKKAVEVDKTVKPYIYFAVIKWEDCSLAETKIFIKRVFDKSITKMLSTILSTQIFTKDELFEIKSITNKKYAKAYYEMTEKLKRKDLYQKNKKQSKKGNSVCFVNIKG